MKRRQVAEARLALAEAELAEEEEIARSRASRSVAHSDMPPIADLPGLPHVSQPNSHFHNIHIPGGAAPRKAQAYIARPPTSKRRPSVARSLSHHCFDA